MVCFQNMAGVMYLGSNARNRDCRHYELKMRLLSEKFLLSCRPEVLIFVLSQ